MRLKPALLMAALVSCAHEEPKAAEPPRHDVPAAQNGGTVVGLCDGKTAVEAPVKPGERMTHAEAQGVSNELMDEWRKKNPQEAARWDKEQKVAQAGVPTGSAEQGQAGAPVGPQATRQSGDTYGHFTDRDRAIWRESTEAFVAEGNRIFHDDKALGGTIGVSCDMCHPNAANTHPETYPKFQQQLGRTALLRDMINWCIENPVRGVPLKDSDPALRALEAYIIAQRRGVALDYGKH